MKTLTLFFALLLALPAAARTINWGNSFGDSLFDSHGSALDDSFVFELGSFGSFTPTENNMEDWLANWKPFDRAQAPDDWNPVDGFFYSSATMLNGQVSSAGLSPAVFSPGEQAYIWVYNTQAMEFGHTEWALVTDVFNWNFPVADGKEELSINWRLSTSNYLVYGGLHDVQGAGDYTVDPGSYAIQTHSVVPEPSSVLLVVAAGALVMIRRRRLMAAGE